MFNQTAWTSQYTICEPKGCESDGENGLDEEENGLRPQVTLL